ncbi:MAG: hypothetical protein RL660_243 [Bacteroidota bacterium]|jgi:hypothetical protein
MKQLVFGLGLLAVTFSACTKKRTTPTGFWTGKLTAPPSEGGAITDMACLINGNGSMVYYSSKAAGDTSNVYWRGVGTWTSNGTNVSMQFVDPSSNHSYNMEGKANADLNQMDGSMKVDVIADWFRFTAVCE